MAPGYLSNYRSSGGGCDFGEWETTVSCRKQTYVDEQFNENLTQLSLAKAMGLFRELPQFKLPQDMVHLVDFSLIGSTLEKIKRNSFHTLFVARLMANPNFTL